MVDSAAVFMDNLPLVVVLTTAVTLLVTLQSAKIARLASTIYHRLLLSLTVRSSSTSTSDTTVVTGLYTYPVKSLRAVSCTSAVIDAKGFVGDRRFLLVTPAPTPLIGYFGPDDATHRFLTQRQVLVWLVLTFLGISKKRL
jgi:MOSC N-terminal beta barrel domain